MESILRDNPLAIFNRILFCHDLSFESCVPAIIKEVNDDHSAFAQPLMKMMTESQEIDSAPILVTTFWDYHGGFEVWHPLSVGDTGWLIAADRNTDLVKQYNCDGKSDGPQNANNDGNLHKYRFGFFFPDRWKSQSTVKQTVPEELQNCFYIQDKNGWAKFLLDNEGHIAITAKSAVKIFSELQVEGDAQFNGSVSISNAFNVDGSSLFNGDVNMNANLNVKKDIRCNDINTKDCSVIDLTVVTDVKQFKDENGIDKTRLTLSKVKLLRSSIISSNAIDIKSQTQENGGGGTTVEVNVDDESVYINEDKIRLKNWNNTSANLTKYLNDISDGYSTKYWIPVRSQSSGGDIKYMRFSSTFDVFHYDHETRTINNCIVLAGRRQIGVSAFTVSANFTGTVYAKITHKIDGSTPTLELNTQGGDNTDEQTIYPIYRFNNGYITTDYRNILCVPLYE